MEMDAYRKRILFGAIVGQRYLVVLYTPPSIPCKEFFAIIRPMEHHFDEQQ